MNSLSTFLCLALLGLAVGGCGAGKSYPATYPVRGVVTLDGAPVEGADVELIPSGAGQGSQGVTGPDGAFTVETPFDSGKVYQPGALPGVYRVTVRKLDLEGARGLAAAPLNLLPKKYADAATSGFSLAVTPAGDNTMDLPLKR
jgi:hypothetical protein